MSYIENRGHSFIGYGGLTNQQSKEIVEKYRQQVIDRLFKKYLKYIL